MPLDEATLSELLTMDDMSDIHKKLAYKATKDKSVIDDLIPLLDNKDQRMVWSVLKTFDYMSKYDFELIKPALPKIVEHLSDRFSPTRNMASVILLNTARRKPELVAEFAEEYMKFLESENDYERRDAAEFLINIAKLRPELVKKYLPRIKELRETEDNPVVRYMFDEAIKKLS